MLRLSAEEVERLQELSAPVRARLYDADPVFIRNAAVVLLVLGRLPKLVFGAVVEISWVDDAGDGNRVWADLRISEHELTASVGAHFYDPDVGGDTETDTVFEADSDGSRTGSLGKWLWRVKQIAEVGKLVLDVGDTEIDQLE
ncbi:hypothetical protein, partial [Thermaurantiacus sp.]